ncbi:hypothetical protein [unidentified bacterial endosymbiont]|uniref:hypothetical protein n=1 Tax=unidentified bacterial endosymbiont TaxID=2355 RepID=UPI0020A17128|nr:hypothetical protein [unidentified bacterial endosymbiont]
MFCLFSARQIRNILVTLSLLSAGLLLGASAFVAPDDKEIALIQKALDNAAKVQNEVVIAAVYPLLRATRNL